MTVTSIGGLIGQPFNDAYCAAKFAVEGMMESLAPVAFELGLSVSLIEPGPVNTEFVSSVYAGSADVLGGVPGYNELVANYAKATGTSFATNGQTGTDIARVILKALTDPNPQLRYLTSEYIKDVAKVKYADLTGNDLLDLSRSSSSHRNSHLRAPLCSPNPKRAIDRETIEDPHSSSKS